MSKQNDVSRSTPRLHTDLLSNRLGTSAPRHLGGQVTDRELEGVVKASASAFVDDDGSDATRALMSSYEQALLPSLNHRHPCKSPSPRFQTASIALARLQPDAHTSPPVPVEGSQRFSVLNLPPSIPQSLALVKPMPSTQSHPASSFTNPITLCFISCQLLV